MSVMNRAAVRWALIAALVGGLAAGDGHRGQSSELLTIGFNGHKDGELAVDAYLNLGLRLAPGLYGGPYFEDAGGLSFLLHTPPNLLSLSPLAPIGVPGQVHASTGTYEFLFVDPTNKWAPSSTDQAGVLLVFADAGTYVMTGWDAKGEIVNETTLTRGFMDFFAWDTLFVSGPGISRVTLTTPGENTLGALVDTLIFAPVPQVAHRPMSIHVNGPRRNVLSLSSQLVTVAILSSDELDPRLLDPLKVLMQGIGPVQYGYADRNGDHVPDLLVKFQIARLGLSRRDVVTVTAVEQDGTPYRTTQEVLVVGRPSGFIGG